MFAKNFDIFLYKIIFWSVIISLSPFNSLGYILPLGFIVLVCFFSKSKKINFNFLVIISAWFYVNILYKYIFLDDYFFGNGVLALITYSSFIPILAIPSKYINGESIFFKLSKVLLLIILLESFLGFFQAIYGFSQIGSFDTNNGDYVEGTIHPQLDSERSMSNPIFSIIMSSIIIFLIAYYRITNIGKMNLYIGILIILMASTMHVILALFFSFIFTSIFLRPPVISTGKKILSLFLITACIILFSKALPSNFGSIYNHGKILLENKYPKTAVIYDFYNDISKNNSIAKAFGLGPGQFLSRASFISTGKYFGTNSDGVNRLEIPFTGMTNAFHNSVDFHWMRSINEIGFGSSSTSKPQSSWNAILTEFGILGSLLLIVITLIFIIRVKNKVINQYTYNISFSLIWCTIFFFLIGFQENYWEVPQAIFIGLLLIKISHSLLLRKYFLKG